MWLAAAALLLGGCSRAPAERGWLEAASDEQVVAEFERLHRRLYQVYSLGPDRHGLHALLASSFEGEALTQEYVEHFATLSRMRADETRVDVLRVDYEAVEIKERDEDRVVVEADWSIGGIVTHQTHQHPRINRYRAVYTLAAQSPPDPAPLLIVASRMSNLERVRTALSDASPFPLDNLPTSASGLLDVGDLLRSQLAEPPPDADPRAESESPP